MSRRGRDWTGPKNPAWKGGTLHNQHGYMRVRHGKYRGWYQHRMITAQLLEEEGAICFYPLEDKGHGRYFPFIYDAETGDVWRFEVHHVDWCKTHNCHNNLLLLDERIHRAISTTKDRDPLGRFKDWKNGEWRVMMHQVMEQRQMKFLKKHGLPLPGEGEVDEEEAPDWVTADLGDGAGEGEGEDGATYGE